MESKAGACIMEESRVESALRRWRTYCKDIVRTQRRKRIENRLIEKKSRKPFPGKRVFKADGSREHVFKYLSDGERETLEGKVEKLLIRRKRLFLVG